MPHQHNSLIHHYHNGFPDLQFIKIIGYGSFGKVYLAFDRCRQKHIAIKRTLKCGKFISRQFQILREIQGCQNCIQLYDIFYSITETKQIIQNLIFQYIPDSLGSFIRTRSIQRNSFGFQEVICIMKQIFQALKHIHSLQIIHRDLKPENILIDHYSFPFQVKICDFGSSKKLSSFNTTYVVSRYYRAPQLTFCCQKYGPAIDIWAAGCIFLELFNQKPIFMGKDEGDQFIKQVNILGPPSVEEIEKLNSRNLVSAQLCAKATKIGFKQDLKVFLKNCIKSEQVTDLVSKMLSWDPEKRPSAAECLSNSIFN